MEKYECHVYKLFFDGIDPDMYIGSTKTPVKYRVSVHKAFAKRGATSKIYKKIRDVGIDALRYEKLADFVVSTKREMLEHEQVYMNQYKPNLNNNRAVINDEQRREYQRVYHARLSEEKKQEYYNRHRDNRKLYEFIHS